MGTVFFHEVVQSSLYLDSFRQSDRLECLKEVGSYSLISQMQQKRSRRKVSDASDASPLGGKNCLFSLFDFTHL